MKTDNGMTGNPDATETTPDTGTPDSGVHPDARVTPDTGPRDTGVTCVAGQEGCECTSSLTPQSMSPLFLQDNCDPGLLCAPFDLADQPNTLDGPVQSCVKACTADGDCGAGRICRTSGFTMETGASKICFDKEAGIDEWCHLSKSRVGHRLSGTPPAPVTVHAAGEMRACAEGVQCFFDFFSDVNPDEGICMTTCMTSAECPSETPYCNPARFTGTSSTGMTVNVGVCSYKQLGLGAICGTQDPDKTGLAYSCDTSLTTDVGCAPVQGFFPDGLGFCAQVCGSQNPCEGTEAGLGPYQCLILDATDQQAGGYCTVNCSHYPDDCKGNGIGFGRMCDRDLIFRGAACNMANPNCPAGFECAMTQNGTLCIAQYPFCMDRQDPVLRPAVVMGGQISDPGDDCNAEPLGFARCPEPAYCETISSNGQGGCVFGCSRTATVTGCEMTTLTATCAEAFTNDNTIGLCSN